MKPQHAGRARTDWMNAAAIAAVAVAARVWVHANTPLSPPLSDMAEYWERAVYIWQHGELYRDSWRMPGLPLALAGVFTVAGGPALEAARWLNIAAGAVTAVLTYATARRSVTAGVARVAALVVALYPTFLVYTSLVATESLVTVPLVATVLAATFRTPRADAMAGVLAALTTLVRPAGIAALAALVVAALRPGARHMPLGRGWRVALTVVAFTLTMTPWWLHNLRLHGRFVPLDTTGGINLLIGSGPLATGRWDFAQVARVQSEVVPGVDVTTPAGADAATAAALAHLRAHPAQVAALTPAKITGLLAIEGREHAYLYSIGYFGTLSPRAVWAWGIAVLAAFPLVLGAAMAGLAVRRGVTPDVWWPIGAFLGASLAMHLLAFGDPRFHLPFVPLLAVLATGLAAGWPAVRSWRLGVAALALAALSLAWAPQLAVYWRALVRLAAPDGSQSALPFDDLL